MNEAFPSLTIESQVANSRSEARAGPFAGLEWKATAPFVFALALVAITLVPDLLGFSFARPGTLFMGTLMNPEDTNSYLAKMEQGYEGKWLYSIPFTSEPHSPEYLGGFYILLGHVARFSSLSITQMWYVARVGLAFVMFIMTFGFIKHFLPDSLSRWIAYSLALTGSGLGWILLALGQNNWLGSFPVDFKMPESHLFFSAMAFPHFSAGITLMLTSVWLSLLALERRNLWFAVGAGLSNFALAIVYPFLILLIAVILGLYLLSQCLSSRRLPWRAGVSSAIAMAIPFPLLIYFLAVLRTNPVFEAWEQQAATPSPNPIQYLMAYGPILILAVPTLRNAKLQPLWLWVLAAAVLVYSPLNAQRRFVEGLQVPLSILAAAGLVSFYLPRIRACALFQNLASRPGYSVRGLERLIVVSLVAFLAISNLYVLLSTGVTAAVDQPYPLFRDQAEVEAVDWAGAHLRSGAVVLSAYETGSLIPARTGLRVVIGHWAETVGFSHKYEQVVDFFQDSTFDEARTKFLRDERAEYLFYGPRERELGSYDPNARPGLTSVYDNGLVQIFRVRE